MSTSTSYPQSTYTLPLLQAINDWQDDSGPEQAKRLEPLCKDLPAYFRECNSTCYRKIDLENTFTVDLLTDDLKEKMSSWTLSLDTAKTFKEGVPPKGTLQGVILSLSPSPSQVILNLTRLYQDHGFISAIQANRKHISNYSDGIGGYWDEEHEVILRIKSVSTREVYSLGGYSSTPEQLMWRGSMMSGLPLSIVYQYLSISGGARWLSHEGTRRVLDRMYHRTLRDRNVLNDRTKPIDNQRVVFCF